MFKSSVFPFLKKFDILEGFRKTATIYSLSNSVIFKKMQHIFFPFLSFCFYVIKNIVLELDSIYAHLISLHGKEQSKFEGLEQHKGEQLTKLKVCECISNANTRQKQRH